MAWEAGLVKTNAAFSSSLGPLLRGRWEALAKGDLRPFHDVARTLNFPHLKP